MTNSVFISFVGNGTRSQLNLDLIDGTDYIGYSNTMIPSVVGTENAGIIGNTGLMTVNATGIYVANDISNTFILFPTSGQKTAGYVLSANGYWIPSGGSSNSNATPGGVNTNVQYNQSGVLGGSSGLTFDYTSNTLTVGGTLLNSTLFEGTANNTLYVGIIDAANVVSNVQLSANLSAYQTISGMSSYQTTAGLSGNVTLLSANNASYLGGTVATSYQLNSTLAANVLLLTANNSSYIGGLPAANVVSNAQLSANLSAYQTTAGLSGNIAILTVNSAIYIGSLISSNVVSNAQLSANLSAYQTNAGLSGNVAGLSSNNASYLGTIAAASYLTNTGSFTISGIYTHTANLIISNTASIIANGSLGSAGQILTTNGSAMYWAAVTASATPGGSNTYIQFNNSGAMGGNASFTYNTTTNTVSIGNTTVNTTINSSSIAGNTMFIGTVSHAQSNILAQTLSFASPITWNIASGQIATVTLTANTTISNPTNLKIGYYMLNVLQDATGSRFITSWGSVYKWPAAIAPTLTTTANSRDVMSFFSDGTNLYGTYINDVR